MFLKGSDMWTHTGPSSLSVSSEKYRMLSALNFIFFEISRMISWIVEEEKKRRKKNEKEERKKKKRKKEERKKRKKVKE